MKRTAIALLLLSASALQAQAPAGLASLVVAWTPNPATENVQGYRIEVQPEAGAAQVLDAGNVSEFKVTGLVPAARYSFRVSGIPAAPYGADGVCATVAGSAPEVAIIVQSYDLQAKRSDPKGLLVRFYEGQVFHFYVRPTISLDRRREVACAFRVIGRDPRPFWEQRDGDLFQTNPEEKLSLPVARVQGYVFGSGEYLNGLAIKSNDTPLEKLRRIAGFQEAE